MHRIAILCLLGVLSLSVVLAATTCADGSGACCDYDSHTVKDAGDYCGPETDCTQQRFCDGTSPVCPTVPKTNSNGRKCSAAINRCFNDGTCDASGNCQAQVQKAENSVCIVADNSKCETARTCSASGTCRASSAAAATVTCHTNTTLCDTTVMCDPVARPKSCPLAAVRDRTPCRPLEANDCRQEMLCPGTRNGGTYANNIICPVQTYMAAGTSCYPGYPNAAQSVCASYECRGGQSGCVQIVAGSENPGLECTSQQHCTGGQTAMCRRSGICGRCRTRAPGAFDDPLIAGFHQQRFWLEGVSGTNYNMYSQPGMTMNALIINAHAKTEKVQTVMGEIAFITKSNVVYITPKAGRNGTVTVNGKSVHLSAKANLYDLDDCVQMAWSPKSLLFSSPEFEIVIAFMEASKAEKLNVDYLNVKIPHVSGDVSKMSGVIGQTAHELNNIDKNWTDFEVSDLYAHDSTLNTFDGSALSCEVSESPKRSIGKFESASQAQLDDLVEFANPMA